MAEGIQNGILHRTLPRFERRHRWRSRRGGGACPKIPKDHTNTPTPSNAVGPLLHHSPNYSAQAYLMRFPSLPTFIRTLYTLSNTTLRAPPSTFAPAARPTALRSSMPTIPFLGALFSTAESRKMSHPVQKSETEWQAQLNPGEQPDQATDTDHTESDSG